MGKLKDNFANQSKGYITFCDFFEFLCDFTGDEPKDVISYLAIQQEFRKLNYYFIIHNYPNIEIIKRTYDELSKNDEYPIDDFIDRVMFDNGVIHTETEEIFLDNYFKIDELFELGFFAEIGLNTERYYSHKRAIQHGIELGIIDKNGIEIGKPSDLQQQLASATNTINRQAEKITELEAQLASIEQANEPNQSNTLADNELLTAIYDDSKPYLYAPELHNAIEVWKLIYHDNLTSQHLTTHSDKFESAIKQLGITFANNAPKDRLKQITTPQQQKEKTKSKNSS